jgi:hypothetical protein
VASLIPFLSADDIAQTIQTAFPEVEGAQLSVGSYLATAHMQCVLTEVAELSDTLAADMQRPLQASYEVVNAQPG